MTDWALMVNLGGQFLPRAAKEGMLAWTREFLADPARRPKLVFAQETFARWVALMQSEGYTVIPGVERGWAVRSAVAHRDDVHLERLDESHLPNLWYHGTYLAAAKWARADGSQAVVVSVHASPDEAYADPEAFGWPESADEPRRRHGGANSPWPNDRLWDADYVLVTLRDLGRTFGVPVLAAGDFNEALADDPARGTWGLEYFRNASELGFESWLHGAWGNGGGPVERPTRGLVQLDHVFVSRGGPDLLASSPQPDLDAAWSNEHAGSTLSDHAAVWFPLATPSPSP